jgi:hypothetical protein
MNNLESVVNEIKRLKGVISMNPGTDVHKRRFNKGKIDQAKQSLKSVYLDYRTSIKEHALFILVTGEQSEEFAKTSQEEFQCFPIFTDKFYQDILDQIPSKIYMNKLASRSFFEHISARFEDRAREIDITSYNPIIFGAKYKKVIKSEEAALDMVKRAMNELVGPEVAAIDAIEKVSIEAVNKDFTGKVIPIVMYTKDESLVKELMSGIPYLSKNLFLISAGKGVEKDLQSKSLSVIKEVTKESVEKTLLKIKKNVL